MRTYRVKSRSENGWSYVTVKVLTRAERRKAYFAVRKALRGPWATSPEKQHRVVRGG